MEVRIRTTNVTANDGPDHRKLLGLIALATDLTCERDLRAFYHMNRRALCEPRCFCKPDNPENLAKWVQILQKLRI